MTDRLNISFAASSIATALLRAGEEGVIAKIDIEGIRAAVIGYLTAPSSPRMLSIDDRDELIEATLRIVVEKVR